MQPRNTFDTQLKITLRELNQTRALLLREYRNFLIGLVDQY